ncbi:VOC family protein [Shimia thalassica]|uniref:VOC family protein n=1 Tax=Shimia thalassica TaxID=1715693 RepID=UPI0027364C83|nr:VOC family protein [Shimia thalassica]MDP2492794.1 VOC family protein [Shimia thalassica]
MQFDHLAVAGETLQAAVSHVEDALGVKMAPGGVHDHFGTHNQLIGLADGLYLEAIAINPSVPTLPYPRWFDLDRFHGQPRISNWICRVPDMIAALADLPDGAGTPVSLKRGDLRWQMAVPASGILPCDGAFPAIIEWQVPTPPGETLAASGCSLTRLEISHPGARWLEEVVPLKDDRVVFVSGDPDMRATFDTPHGCRELS